MSAGTARKDEQLGKPFMVSEGMRYCMVCERTFTPRAAALHASVVCYPPGIKPLLRINANW
jgi:hypothetical protein